MKDLFRIVSTFFKVSIREKNNVFWVMIFPLILFTMIYVSFSGISNMEPADLELKIGLEADHPDKAMLEQIDILSVREMTREEAEQAIKEGEIEAFVTEELGMVVENSSTNTHIIRGILTEFKQTKALGLRAILAAANRGGYYAKDGVQDGSLNVSFYNIFAMFSLYGYFSAVHLVQMLQADQSMLAERNAASPMRKSVGVTAVVITSLIVIAISMGLLLTLSEVILKLNLIRDWPASILILFMGAIFGTAEGLFFGSLNLPFWLISLIGVGGKLFMSMLSGMMSVNVRNLVMLKAPWLNFLNPVSVVTESFYRVNMLDRGEEVWRAFIFLAAFSLIFFLLSTFKLKRTTYEKLS